MEEKNGKGVEIKDKDVYVGSESIGGLPLWVFRRSDRGTEERACRLSIDPGLVDRRDGVNGDGPTTE